MPGVVSRRELAPAADVGVDPGVGLSVFDLLGRCHLGHCIEVPDFRPEELGRRSAWHKVGG